jgi:bifunctional non-homologous end joining protein LigD
MTDPFAVLSAEARRQLRKRQQPSWAGPMLATLTNERFSDPDWIFERKLDGIRCLAFRKGSHVTLLSRNRAKKNAIYPELIEPLARQPSRDFIVDGEIIAFKGRRTSFSRLQQRMAATTLEAARRSRVSIYYYLFDLLHLNGHDTTALALRDRKALLERAFMFTDPIRFSRHWNTHGEKYHERACRLGWEGLIAKRADSTYQHHRSNDWLKFKCGNQQELVIGGFTPPRGKRTGFGALLVGYYENGNLLYAGKVGTGYTEQTLRSLTSRLRRLQQAGAPFTNRDAIGERQVTWVRPSLVAEVAFTEWTRDGKLRHPRYLGLRSDKPAREVVREKPQK